MKFFSTLAVVSACATTALAQGIKIASPVANASVSSGSQLVVEVDRPVSYSI